MVQQVAIRSEYYNINECRGCGRTNEPEHQGDWFWATPRCDVCSDCAAKLKVVIYRGKYSRPSSNLDRSDPVERAKKVALEKFKHRMRQRRYEQQKREFAAAK